MSMWEYEPGVIYTNLIKLMEYRGAVVTSNVFDSAQLILQMNQHGYAIITANCTFPTQHILAAIVVAPDSAYSSKTVEFRRLIREFPKVIPGITHIEVIISAKGGLTNHITKAVTTYNLEQTQLPTPTHIFDYDYKYFVVEIPKHNNCDPTSIATDEEVAEFCERHYVTKQSFPKIIQSDPVAVWYGLKPGMVAKVIRASETAGISEQMRLCCR